MNIGIRGQLGSSDRTAPAVSTRRSYALQQPQVSMTLSSVPVTARRNHTNITGQGASLRTVQRGAAHVAFGRVAEPGLPLPPSGTRPLTGLLQV